MAVTASITDSPIDVAGLITSVMDPRAGGIATFVGAVRREPANPAAAGAEVVSLEYEAHPTLAEPGLRSLAATAAERWDLVKVAVVHRTGRCGLGEPTVVVACSSAHRRATLEACHWLIDELKKSIPIWKKEIYADGSAWIGSNTP